MSSSLILVILSTLLGFCLSLIVLILWQKMQNRGKDAETRRMEFLRKRIDTILSKDETIGQRAFEATLEKASLKTSLQIPRLNNQLRTQHGPPEKYQILSNLAAKGMACDELANILGISDKEASQLLTLHAIAQVSAGHE